MLKGRSFSNLRLNYGQNPSNVVSREAVGVVRVDVEFNTSLSTWQDACRFRNGFVRGKLFQTAQTTGVTYVIDVRHAW